MANDQQEIEKVLLKINNNIIALQKVQNMLISTVIEINNHNKDLNAHKHLINKFQLGMDMSSLITVKSDIEQIITRINTIEQKNNELITRVNNLEVKNGINNS